MQAPDGILCAKTHEYLLQKDSVYKFGITDYAVEQLGDIVFVEMPEVGTEFEKGEILGTIESVKAASELYMPANGKIVEINETLIDNPELVNNSPYEDGWIVKIETEDEKALNALMEYEDYQEFIEE
ncbi:MAG: glycine cleavage system protein GcvH [Candidatus Gastranaerophilales bacterium]|nr:glycine cleavage system protein GcvH [Candidatus Gastranaerophilales bacterium]